MRYSKGEKRRCVLSHIDVAQRAGVSRSTVRTAVTKAEKVGDLVVKRIEGEPNVMRFP